MSICLPISPCCLQWRSIPQLPHTQHNNYSPTLFILPRLTFRESTMRYSPFLNAPNTE
jgi:hypothetical protein